MKRSSLLGFILLNVIVTFVTVGIMISVWSRFSPPPAQRSAAPPLVVIVTATLDPNATSFVQIITATPDPERVVSAPTQGDLTAVAANPTNAIGNSTTPPTLDLGNIPTLDPSLLPVLNTAGTEESNGANGTSNGCQTYAIKKGDTLGKIAETFGVTTKDLMAANKLTERDLTKLQIGQSLTIPINGCGIATDEPTPTITPTEFVLPTLPPTSTIAPTAATAQLQIVTINNPGDLTQEGVVLQNMSGGVIQMKGWLLKDGTGLQYTFPEYRLFPNGKVTLFTKEGVNTPVVLFWGQSKALWGDPNQVITVVDANGEVQATFSVSAGASLPPSGNTATDGQSTGQSTNGQSTIAPIVPTPTSGS